ncbi:932_t:CDS:2 [Racocetra fulgida]|uniref:932_t:CDS:1 n=1 Tax=Racocetra fulgida TaxID=60492 RepID=A0A9N9F5R0_9GLOM|nr:932_t:CDS:2 [Racocetra fulgida]
MSQLDVDVISKSSDNDNYDDDYADDYADDYIDNNFSASSSSCLEIKAKTIIKVKSSTPMPVKWFTFNANNFYIFNNKLTNYIHKCIDDVDIDKDDIKISYNVNGHGQEMALEDNNDYATFIDIIEVEDSDEERVTKKLKPKR